MNLGLAAIGGNAALNGYNNEQQVLNNQQRFAWEQQRANADLSLIPDKVSAARASLQNQQGADQAAIQLRPQDTQNKQKSQAITGYGLDRAQSRQPTTEDTADLGAQAANTDAQVATGLSGAKAQDLPRLIQQQRAQGIIDDVGEQQAAVKGLATLIDMGDNAAVVKYLNDMNAIAPAHAQRFAAPVAKVGTVQNPDDPNDRLFVAVDADGNPVRTVSINKLRAAISNPQPVKLKPGETIGTMDSRGQYAPSYTAPESQKNRIERMGPLERDVNYLTTVHGMSQEKALTYLNSAKSMSRQQFILKGISDVTALGKKPTDADIQNFGAMYDKATGNGAAVPPQPGLGAAPAPASPAAQPAAAGADPVSRAYGLIGITPPPP